MIFPESAGELLRAQERHQVVVPAWWEPELMGLVEAWARGVAWNDLIANTSLDEGDVVRIMRRTIDLLAQVPYCEAIGEQLRSHARQALKAINRFLLRKRMICSRLQRRNQSR